MSAKNLSHLSFKLKRSDLVLICKRLRKEDPGSLVAKPAGSRLERIRSQRYLRRTIVNLTKLLLSWGKGLSFIMVDRLFCASEV